MPKWRDHGAERQGKDGHGMVADQWNRLAATEVARRKLDGVQTSSTRS